MFGQKLAETNVSPQRIVSLAFVKDRFRTSDTPLVPYRRLILDTIHICFRNRQLWPRPLDPSAAVFLARAFEATKGTGLEEPSIHQYTVDRSLSSLPASGR